MQLGFLFLFYILLTQIKIALIARIRRVCLLAGTEAWGLLMSPGASVPMSLRAGPLSCLQFSRSPKGLDPQPEAEQGPSRSTAQGRTGPSLWLPGLTAFPSLLGSELGYKSKSCCHSSSSGRFLTVLPTLPGFSTGCLWGPRAWLRQPWLTSHVADQSVKLVTVFSNAGLIVG